MTQTEKTADISLEQSATKGRYVARLEGIEEVAELTFSVAGDQLVIADHTGVPDSMRGMGIGKQLVDRLVADAREKNFKIVPLCPFVDAQRKKHPEWADVFQP